MNIDVFAKLMAVYGIIIAQESALSSDIFPNDDTNRSNSVVSVDASDFMRCDEWNAGCSSCSN